MSVRNEQRGALGNMIDMKNVETEDKTIIVNLLQTISTNDNVSYSFKIFPTIIYLTVTTIGKLELTLLDRLYLASERVKSIYIDLLSKSIVIKIKKIRAQDKVTIKKRILCNNSDVKEAASKFIKENPIIRSEDDRLLIAIVTLFFKWTWQSVACDISIEREGDNYLCIISNLLGISYKQLQSLESLGNWVHKITFDFENKSVLTFNVSRTETINDNTPSYKRVKYS